MAAVNDLKPDCRLLVADLAFIGDIIMSTPAYENIRRGFPTAHIDLLISPGSRPVIEHSGWFNRIYTTGMKTGGWKSIKQESELTRAECYDAVICFHRGHGTLLMLRLAGVRHRLGFTHGGRSIFLTGGIPFRIEKHRAWNHLKLVEECLPIDVDYNIPTLMTLDQVSIEKIGGLIAGNSDGNPLAAINPNAAWTTKRWLPERFGELADRISDMGFQPVLVGGPKEKDIAEAVKSASKSKIWDVTGETTLMELAALLSRCRFTVSNDSGPMHISQAVGTPVISIFGPTDPNRCGPWLGTTEPVQADIDCIRCYQKKCWHMTCMEKVDVSTIIGRVQDCISITPNN